MTNVGVAIRTMLGHPQEAYRKACELQRVEIEHRMAAIDSRARSSVQ